MSLEDMELEESSVSDEDYDEEYCNAMYEAYLNGDIMSVESFIKACEINAFVDDDGYGELIDESGNKTGFIYSPSEVADIPKGYPKIAWYNK